MVRFICNCVFFLEIYKIICFLNRVFALKIIIKIKHRGYINGHDQFIYHLLVLI